MDVGGPKSSRLIPAIMIPWTVLKADRLADIQRYPLIVGIEPSKYVKPRHVILCRVGSIHGELII